MTIVKKIASEPAKVLKKTVGTLKEPASSESSYKIAVGVAVSPIIAFGYGKAFDYLIGLVPTLPDWAKTAIKIFLPLVPTPFIYKFNVPMGAVINGGLYGTFALQVGLLIYELITGKGFSGITTKSTTAKASLDAPIFLESGWGIQ